MYYMYCMYLLGQLSEHSVLFYPALLHINILSAVVSNHFEQINDDDDDVDDVGCPL